MSFRFEVLYTSKKSRARVGRIHTPHGIIETPGFVPVGTNGCLKGLTSHNVTDLDVQLLFCNTYHLMVQPGLDVIEAAGGLHAFMNRQQPIITDSGGFQVFSLAYGGYTQELKSKG
ncbi:MAG: tRNA-guanine transglycosylase, partial [bacterium]